MDLKELPKKVALVDRNKVMEFCIATRPKKRFLLINRQTDRQNVMENHSLRLKKEEEENDDEEETDEEVVVVVVKI